MNRRAFPLVLAFTALLPGTLVARAQAADNIWRLGVLSPIDDPLMSTTLSQLAARGFVEGRNLVVDIRVGTAERMPELAGALVSTRPDVIMARG